LWLISGRRLRYRCCLREVVVDLDVGWPAMKPPSSKQTSEFDSSDEEPIEDEQTPIQISWLPLSRVNCSQFLGLCALPDCKFKDARRNIQKDTEELRSYGIQDIFVFCTIEFQTFWISTISMELSFITIQFQMEGLLISPAAAKLWRSLKFALKITGKP